MADQAASEEPRPWGEPKTVERLRAMVQQLDPEVRACSTTLWAADEIERLRRERAAALESVAWRAQWMDRAVLAMTELRNLLDADSTWADVNDLLAEEFDDGDDDGEEAPS